MASQIEHPVKFIAELFRSYDFDPRLSIPDLVFDRVYNIYHFSVAPLITDEDNYWIKWGGTFDNPVGYGMQIFFNQFLVEVFLSATLIALENSFWIDKDNDKVYIHLPRNPWGFYEWQVDLLMIDDDSAFASAPKDINNLSDTIYDGTKFNPVMSVPSLQNKLNDIISGIYFYSIFDITIDNSDGKYDRFNVEQFYNTPMQISKSSDNAQSVEDFERVKYGIISDITVAFDQMRVEASDILYTLNADYCRKFTVEEFPNIEESLINKNIPVAWGDINGVELFQVDKSDADPPTWADYIAVDNEYLTAVDAVYDDDGAELVFSYNATTGIIRVTSVDEDGEVIEGKSADVAGLTDNSIGDVVIYALTERERLPYSVGIWDIDETDRYLAKAYSVGYYFNGGTTRQLIEGVLKNDSVFLIQKNNGLLTLRRWGDVFDQHDIPSWTVTKKPEKNFKDASQLFCSSVKILSEKKYSSGVFQKTYINDTSEIDIFKETKKSFLAEFETALLDDDDIEAFSVLLINRFGTVRETLRVGVGLDTHDVNLLDTVNLNITINGRNFSDYRTWLVKGVDPGQDELILEGREITVGNWLTFDTDIATIDDLYFEVSFPE
jgi:hypothetical protein